MTATCYGTSVLVFVNH